MRNLLKISIALIMALATYTTAWGQSQTWKPAMEGLLNTHQLVGQYPSFFQIHFKPNGPFGKNWIHGYWLDNDSVARMAGYRKGGQWKSLPFFARQDTLPNSSYISDMVQYGDTLYMGGHFRNIIREKDSIKLATTSILKMHQDSIWSDEIIISLLTDLEVSGDSLLAYGSTYVSDSAILGGYLLSTDGGQSWSNAFDMSGPDSMAYWGPGRSYMEIRNGSIHVLYEGQGPYDGVVSWDGNQWQGRGQGFYGHSWLLDFSFFQNELYLAGSFSKAIDERNPGSGIVSYNGQQWKEVGGGIHVIAGNAIPNGVDDLFTHGNKLYAIAKADRFGDAGIRYLAAWDGQQWCGTPLNYLGPPPSNYGIINDTLYAVCHTSTATGIGQPLTFLNYFDGDYVNGPNAICSTPGLDKKELAPQSGLELYPVPAGEELHIASHSAPIQSLKVYDLTGRQVMQQQFYKKKGKVDLALSQLVPGLYFLKVNGQGAHPFVKK